MLVDLSLPFEHVSPLVTGYVLMTHPLDPPNGFQIVPFVP